MPIHFKNESHARDLKTTKIITGLHFVQLQDDEALKQDRKRA